MNYELMSKAELQKREHEHKGLIVMFSAPVMANSLNSRTVFAKARWRMEKEEVPDFAKKFADSARLDFEAILRMDVEPVNVTVPDHIKTKGVQLALRDDHDGVINVDADLIDGSSNPVSTKMCNAVRLQLQSSSFAQIWQRMHTVTVVILGDCILDANHQALDGNNIPTVETVNNIAIPKWSHVRPSGNGTEGGVWESTFFISWPT